MTYKACRSWVTVAGALTDQRVTISGFVGRGVSLTNALTWSHSAATDKPRGSGHRRGPERLHLHRLGTGP